MSTKDERQSLMQEPLPTVLPSGVIPELVLTYIASLDQDIARHRREIELETEPLNEALNQLEAQREIALQYAIQHDITEDDQYRLNRMEKPSQQKVNVKLLVDKYPVAMNWIYQQRTATLEAAAADMRDMKTEIIPSQNEAKAALKTINVPLDAVLYRPGEPTIFWNVVRKL